MFFDEYECAVAKMEPDTLKLDYLIDPIAGLHQYYELRNYTKLS